MRGGFVRPHQPCRRHARRMRATTAPALAAIVLAAVPLAAPGAAAQQPATQQPAAGQPPAGAEQPSARAVFIDATGRQVGSASLVETPHGVLIVTNLAGFQPGTYAYHIHETGQCAPPGFETAGGHFNPTGRRHGFLAEEGPHAGDLPNITVGSDGTLQVEHLARDVTLRPGQTSVLDQNGSALVIHQNPDDYRTDPAGNSGPRIACGVIAP